MIIILIVVMIIMSVPIAITFAPFLRRMFSFSVFRYYTYDIYSFKGITLTQGNDFRLKSAVLILMLSVMIYDGNVSLCRALYR